MKLSRSIILAVAIGLLAVACGAKPETLPTAPRSDGPSTEDINKAVSLVARTMPAADAFGGLAPLIADDGMRVKAGRPAGASSLLCDVGNQAPLPAEREGLATASTAYQRIPSPSATASWQMNLSALALPGQGSDQALTELRSAVTDCPGNPVSIMRDVKLGTLDGTNGVVFRSTVDGSPVDFAATCVIERNADIYLRSCGLSTNSADTDNLATQGLLQLRANLDTARKSPDATFTPEPAIPSWMSGAAPANVRKTPPDACSLLSTQDVKKITGRNVASFDAQQCSWKLDAGSVSLSQGSFTHRGLAARGVVKGNPSYQDDHREDSCASGVIFAPHASIDTNVTVTVSGKRPCDVAKQLISTAFDRLPR